MSPKKDENPKLPNTSTLVIPVLPLRDVVVYPHMIIPLFVGRDKSIRALAAAMEGGKQILLVSQKSAAMEEPILDDVYLVGTIASILQLLKLPDGTVKVLVEGVRRARVARFVRGDDFFAAQVGLLGDTPISEQDAEVLVRSMLTLFDKYVKLNKRVPPEILSSLAGIKNPGRLADTIAAHMSLKIEEKQKILEIDDERARLVHLNTLLESEIDLLEVEKRIKGRVKNQMEKNQREYYLNEQMKAIQKELGELTNIPNEIDDLTQKITKVGMSKEAKSKATSELNKLKMMAPLSPEATVVRNYIDWLVTVPWKKRSKVSNDLGVAEKVLEADHYSLKKVKERILEYLAVQQRVQKSKGPILCLVGPPGVGKTSLGQSIARATNRKFVRIALGGIRDEAEIRGHRRTYIGSLPGKIIQKLTKAGTKNPLFLLDEVDKMSMDFRGDPSSALLEVLDPEQNHTFNDHYLEVDYDLSDVMFVATANTLNIPPPLLDRMEVIRLPGYTEDEKISIAKRYLIPKQTTASGIKNKELMISEPALLDIVRYYTKEAGVRNLEREISKICRKVVKSHILHPCDKRTVIIPRNLEKYLEVKKFRYGRAEENNQVGQVTGLAWTEVGGELLTIEATVVPGKGELTITGKLGDIMQESVRAAVSVVRNRSFSLGLDSAFYQKHDFHVHVPEGATPKDGPSAGVGICTALISTLTSIPVHANVAMTGEITLRGRVLPIGGLKEKLLAAHRGGIEIVLIPEENRRDLADIPANVKQNLEIKPVSWIEEVIQLALERVPQPRRTDDEVEGILVPGEKIPIQESNILRPH